MRRVALLAVVVTALMILSIMSAGASQGAPETFTISGEVDELFPGFDGTLPAQVSNPFDQPIRVMSLAGSVSDPAPGCTGSELTVADAAPDFVVADGATMTVPLHVALARSAPAECQGVTFEITFVGTAVGSDGSAPADGRTRSPSPARARPTRSP